MVVCCTVFPSPAADITVCSFNIKWLGHYTAKEYQILAKVISQYDVVAIQELVAPPYLRTLPDSTALQPDPEAAAFFNEMTQVHGYTYLLSPEGTGTEPTNHASGTGTEWFALFYRAARFTRACHLPTGFVCAVVKANGTFDRVPYAFALRSVETGFDFVIVSVHLHAGDTSEDARRRSGELQTVACWIRSRSYLGEKHYIILGDMNFADCSETTASVPDGLWYLNPDSKGGCVSTSVGLREPHPYDNVLYTPDVPLDEARGLTVVRLLDAVASTSAWLYPEMGGASASARFAEHFSDHNPVVAVLQEPPYDVDSRAASANRTGLAEWALPVEQ